MIVTHSGGVGETIELPYPPAQTHSRGQKHSAHTDIKISPPNKIILGRSIFISKPSKSVGWLMQFVFIYISGCMKKLYILILYKLPNLLGIAAKLTVFEPDPTPGKETSVISIWFF